VYSLFVLIFQVSKNYQKTENRKRTAIISQKKNRIHCGSDHIASHLACVTIIENVFDPIAIPVHCTRH